MPASKEYADPFERQGADGGLAFKWIRILHRCWKDHKPYDEALYLQTLKQHGSELANLIVLRPQEA